GKGTEPEPKHHLSFRERADGRLDHVRMIRDQRYAYHKNYFPFAPAGHHLAYIWKAPAAPAWEKHHREGKTNAITGRWFEARVSEEFYDNHKDLDNVHNLNDAKEHQAKIAELKAALRKKQLELHDSGLLPEAMRARRAKANGITIYEMVRNSKLYPLKEYLDAADMALARDAKNLGTLTERLADEDEGMRWWAIVGLHLLEGEAKPATGLLKAALKDDSHEVRMMSAWTLVKLGHEKDAMKCLNELLFGETNAEVMLHNVIDWMGKPAWPLVKKYIAKGGTRKGRYGIGILGRIAQLNGW
ncbi:MAG: HEAT repeat domain-containing protein, partial [Planctomycetota bacterium]